MRATKLPSDSCLIRREPRKEKDPGSAFGPESVPLATGSVPVVYWVPGPFPGPAPVQPDERGKPFVAVLVPRLPWGLASNLPLIPAMSTVNPAVILPRAQL
jgi:hypothetical protein